VRLGLPTVVVVAAALLAACGSHPDAGASRPRSSSSTASAPDSTAAAAGDTATPLRCEEPSKALLDWASVSIVGETGPILRSALVHAATTPTGDWYVLAVDRESVYDDGTSAGTGSRALGLTNAVDGKAERDQMIPLGTGPMGKPLMASWRRVSWTGSTLAAGRAAAERAIACLDAAG